MIKHHVFRLWAVALLFLAFGYELRAQLTLDASLSPEEIAELLVGTGVQVTNVTVIAADSSYSTYNANGTELGTSEGLLLTTGNIINAIGPNDESGLPLIVDGECLNCDFYDNEFQGSELLNNAQDRTTFDATHFEIEIVVQGDSLAFDFTFASEEYLEWVGSPFNDVFGFFISGPNIGTDVNIAIVPNTTDPVAINTVNPGMNAEYYYDNTNPLGQFIQYDGFTTGLTAAIGNLIPCETYTLKLIIADGTDRIYDSAVFIEKIESNPVNVITTTAGGIDFMIEGCNDGTITFERPEASPEELDVLYWIGGTAIDGVDFTPMIGTGTPGDPLHIFIPPNETSISIDIEAVADGLDEGTEYLTIYLANPLCDNNLQDSINFFIHDFLEVNIDPIDPTICLGSCVELVSDALTAGLSTFTWDPIDGLDDPLSTSPLACPTVETTYTITSNVSECEATASTTVSVQNMQITLTANEINCSEAAFGTIDLEVIDGTEPITFDWTGPNDFTANTEDLSDLLAGTYCVTVTDDLGCIAVDCIDIVETQVLFVSEVDSSNYTCYGISCFGACDGFITVTADGGIGNYTYSWDDPLNQTGPTASDLCAGTYTVTISDEGGCVIMETYTLGEPDPLDIELVGTVDVLCNGEETGLATVSATGGCTPYFYSWSHDPLLTAPIAIDLPSGTFTVSVSDINGCESGDSVTLEIGEPGEPIDATFDIPVYPGGFNVSCPDASDGSIDMTITGGVGLYDVQWFENGFFVGATEDLTDIPCGIYSVTITDENDCVFQADVEVSCPPNIEIDFTTVPNPCLDPNAGLGEIDITVTGGFGGFMYDWTGPDAFTAITEDITGLNSGTYQVTVTDAQGCTETLNIIVPTSEEITILPTIIDAECGNECGGSIELDVSGGNGNYTYVWTGPNEFSSIDEDIFDLCAGNYIVVVTDEGGCTQVLQIEILEPTPITITVIEAVPPTCSGQNDGFIDISVSGGTGMLDIEWLPVPGANFPGAITEDINSLEEAIYTVVVTDESGCQVSLDIDLSAPQVMEIFVDVTVYDEGFNVSCFGAQDGEISVSVSGGTTGCPDFDPWAYGYDWGSSPIGDNDPASPILEDLGGGTFTVIVTDCNGCIATTVFPMEEPDQVDIEPDFSPTTCQGEDNGFIVPSLSGGNGNWIDYDWSMGDPIGMNEADADTLFNLPPGTYTLEVTDSNGCTGMETFVIEEGDPIDITVVSLTLESCYELSDGAIAVIASGGTGNFTYDWTGPSCPCSGSVISGVTAGTYILTVTDDAGCSVTEEIILDAPALFDINLTVPILDSAEYVLPCFGDETGAIFTEILGGVPTVTWEWTLDGAFYSTDLNLTELSVGTYCITASDGAGCVNTECVDITEPPEPMIVTSTVFEYGNGFNISCFGECDGSIDLEVSGGVPPYTFIWRDENDVEIAFTEDLIDACSGEYEVVVSDSNGCEQTLSFDLTEPPQIVIDSTVSDYTGFGVSCFGETDGFINIDVSGGNPGYTFEWTGDIISMDEDLSNLGAGTYILTVTDASGCQAITTFILEEPLEITFDEFVNNSSCDGTSNGFIDAGISGGSGGYIISWIPDVGNTEVLTDLEPGDYTINVTDSNGCMGSETFNVPDPTVMTVDGVATEAFCGEAVGTIDITVTDGLPPITFTWTGPTSISDGTEDPVDLLPGDYTVTVTDANDCEIVFEITVPGPPPISGNGVVTDVTCNGDEDGSIVLDVQGGVDPISIVWLDEANQQVGTGSTLENISGGAYTAVIEGADGCTVEETYSVIEFDAIIFNGVPFLWPNGYNISEFEGSDGLIETDVTGGNPQYAYEWDGPTNIDDDTEDPVGLTAGEYTLTVTDQNGCVRDTTFVLDQPFDLALPTGLSPNDDGLNDFYVILGIDQYPDNRFVVFNRWGNIVFEKDNYENEWYGQNDDGEDLPDGTYFVIFEAENEAFNTYVDLRR